MRILNVLTGGYWRVMDRLLDLQNEAFTLGNAPLAGLGYDLVLQGCAVTDNGNGTINIAPGLILINGVTLRFDGANNVAADGSQTFITGPVVASNPKPFADGSTKNIYSEQKAIITAQDPSNTTQIKIGITLYDLNEYMIDLIYQSETKGTIKEIYDLDGTFKSTNFDRTGLGVTRRWIGWAIDNANNGTPGSAGQVLVASGTYTDPESGAETIYVDGDNYGTIGVTLTAAEIPKLESEETFIKDGGGHLSSFASGNDAQDLRPLNINEGGGGPHENRQPSKGITRLVKIV